MMEVGVSAVVSAAFSLRGGVLRSSKIKAMLICGKIVNGGVHVVRMKENGKSNMTSEFTITLFANGNRKTLRRKTLYKGTALTRKG